MKILIINGPNLNMLGIREPALYGRQDYHALGNFCKDACRELSAELSDEIECEIYLDALKAVQLPAAEVHLTDVNAREPFRRLSYAGMACEKHYIGYGFEGYRLAVKYLAERHGKRKGTEYGS